MIELIGNICQAMLCVMVGYFWCMFKEGYSFAKEWRKVKEVAKRAHELSLRKVSMNVTNYGEGEFSIKVTAVDDGFMMIPNDEWRVI